MPDGWSRVPLSAVARLDIERVTVRPQERYRIAGVLNAGQGLFGREAILGSETRYAALHRLRAGQLVMRKLTAWEGPITTVPAEFDGWFVSPEFPTYTLTTELDPAFMRLVCQRPEFWEAMRLRSTGTVQRRKRVNPDQLLKVEIDLPPHAEQRRIADLVGATDTVVDRARTVAIAAQSLYRRAAADLFDGSTADAVPLGVAAQVRMGRQRAPRFAEGLHVLPYLRAANVKDGRLELGDVLRMNFEPGEQAAYALAPGDVLVTEGCGSLAQLGASARWENELPGVVCFQNTLIRLRARPGITEASYIYHLARHAHAAGWWASIASGTNIFHIGSTRAEQLRVEVPALDDQLSAAKTLDAIDGVTKAADNEVAALLRLRTGMVTELLKGGISLPVSYDRFLDRAA